MKKKIYSRTITREDGSTYLDRIQVKEMLGVLFVVAHSNVESNGEMDICHPHRVSRAVKDLIDGKGECPYTLES